MPKLMPEITKELEAIHYGLSFETVWRFVEISV